jgi:hypothetical protein
MEEKKDIEQTEKDSAQEEVHPGEESISINDSQLTELKDLKNSIDDYLENFDDENPTSEFQ